jgi:MFS family permease
MSPVLFLLLVSLGCVSCDPRAAHTHDRRSNCDSICYWLSNGQRLKKEVFLLSMFCQYFRVAHSEMTEQMEQGARRLLSRIESFLSLEHNVLAFSMTGLLINFGVQVFQPFIPFYLQTLRASIPEIGIVFAGMAIATNLMSIPGGILADRIGRKTIIVVGNIAGFGLYLALLGVGNWTTALLVLFMATVFATLVQPAYSATVAESVKVRERTHAFGTFYVLVYLGWALGSALGGILPNPGRYELNILVVAVAGIGAALCRLIFLRETLPSQVRVEAIKSGKLSFLGHLTRNVWFVLIALFTFNFSSGLGQPIYAIFSTSELHLSKSEFAMMVSFGYLASMLGAFGAGRVSKKLGIKIMMIFALLVQGFLIVPWLYSPNAPFAIGFFALSGFFSQFFFVGNQTLMANVTRAKERSSVIGFISMTAGLGGIIAPYVGGELWVLLGARVPFIVSAAVAAVVAVPLALIQESNFERS